MRKLLAVVTLVACGPSARQSGDDDNQQTPDAPLHVVDTNNEFSRVYAHSGNTLYRVDASTLTPMEIGTMAGLGSQSLTDLAIDKNDNMVGITLDKLYAIDSTTAAVTLVKDLSQSANGFTSLSYIPQDLSDPASEDLLVSANDQGEVFQIDPATGNATKLGSYGTVALGKVISSGDLIGVRGFGIYATVNVGTETSDYLAKIDPATWKATPLGSGTGYSKIFGLGFWAGTIYGFVDMGTGAGKIITIDPNTGAGSEIQHGAVTWFGAGVSTDAPILQ
jgi:hypothetical protein